MIKDFLPKALGILVGFTVLLLLNVYWIQVEEALFQTVIQTLCIILTLYIMTRYKTKNTLDEENPL